MAQDDHGPEPKPTHPRDDDRVWTQDTEVGPEPGGGGPSLPPRLVDASAAAFARDEEAARYDVGALLGEGGMGEVRLCRDRRIGRDVAMKLAKSGIGSRPDLVARFLREVRVQGQLEHPGVVPVYDLTEDEGGRQVFTMKRVRGRTLEEVMEGFDRGDPEMERSFTRPKLLAALSRVCLTVEFAHSRGVVHRDIKPANIMLGDFGEVYVLDWGIARIVGEKEDERAAGVAVRDEGELGQTEAGVLLGTPGYMSPEQAKGEVASPQSDVYALGAILFELVTRQPLHASRSVHGLLVSTLQGVEARPSVRVPDASIPPDFDAICVQATKLDPMERLASARLLAEAIDSMLDGERDLERRRELATRHVESARRLQAEGGSEAAPAVMRELGRALAFDPAHEAALGAMREVLLDTDDRMSPEAEQELFDINRRDRARSALRMGLGTLVPAAVAPLVVWMGVRDVKLYLVLLALGFAQAAYAFWMGLTHNAHPKFMRFFILLSSVSAATFIFPFGPFVLLPVIASLNAASLLVSLRPNQRTRLAILASTVASVAVPVALDVFVLHRTQVGGGEIRIIPSLIDFTPLPTLIALVTTAVLPVIATNVLVGLASKRLVELERRIFGQAWRLRNLLPEGTTHRVPVPVVDG